MVFGIFDDICDVAEKAVGEVGEFVSNPVDKTINTTKNIIYKTANEVEEFVDNPINKTVAVVTKPVRDGIDIIDGLSEGELRTKAVLSLGIDVVSGMGTSELIDWYGTIQKE